MGLAISLVSTVPEKVNLMFLKKFKKFIKGLVSSM